ncbi:MAG: 30S ribosomal protein S6 [Patescibacteria group bacterium]
MANKEKESLVEEVSEKKINIYELGYLLVPSITEENLPVVFTSLKDLILSFGGKIISEENPKMTSLAYTMVKSIQNINHKFNTGYFGWIKFSMDTEEILKLKKKLDLSSDLVRFLLFKTIAENTTHAKNFTLREPYKKFTPYKKDQNKKASPINKEEVDKEIDALVGVV